MSISLLLCAVLAATLAKTAPATAAIPSERTATLVAAPQTIAFDPAADLAAGRTKYAANVAVGADGALRVTQTADNGRLADSYGMVSGTPRSFAFAFASATVSYAAAVPQGATAAVDVRFSPDGQTWTLWKMDVAAGATLHPATDISGPFSAAQTFTTVQYRLRLAPGANGATPAVRDLRVTATQSDMTLTSATPGSFHTLATPPTYHVYGTREGLVGWRTANGHIIQNHDHFVSLPDCSAVSDPGTNQYQVRITAPNGNSATAPVWDCGPWNFHDDYWHSPRREFTDLPVGMPEAQPAALNHYNNGLNEAGRGVYNPSGIDIGDGTYIDDLGIGSGAGGYQFDVTFLWENGGSSAPAPTPAPDPAPAPPINTGVTDFVGYVVANSVGINAATITWTTTTPTTSQIEWSMDSSFGAATPVNTALTINHSVTLVDLTPHSLYHFRARSRDAAGTEIVGLNHSFVTQPGETAPLQTYAYDPGLTAAVSANFDRVDIGGVRSNGGDWATPGFLDYRSGAYLRDTHAAAQGNLDFDIFAACDTNGNNCSLGNGSGNKAYVQFGLISGDFVRYGVIHDPGIAPKGIAYFVESRVGGVFKATYGVDGSANGGVHHFHLSWINGVVRGFWDHGSISTLPAVAFNAAGVDIAFVGAARGWGDSLTISFRNIGFSANAVQ